MISISFAYYQKGIVGNTNSSSVIISLKGTKTALVELDMLSATTNFTNLIEPGYENIRIYTIENISNEKATFSIYLTDVYNDFERYKDIEYTLYRNKGKNSIDQAKIDTYEVISKGVYPRTDNLLIDNQVLNNEKDAYTYALKVNYKSIPTEDQGVDMEHIFSGKLTISGNNDDLNPFEKNTLAYNILDNSLKSKNDTVFRKKTLTEAGKEISLETEKELSIKDDDYGVSYYFRGNVDDNYLELNNTCFRIVRILGNGTISLVLANDGICSESTSSSGVLNMSSFNIENFFNYLQEWYNQKGFNNTVINNWCNDITGNGSNLFSHDRLVNINNAKPKLSCVDKIIESYVGGLTADEVALSGSTYETISEITTNYLNQNAVGLNWWTITPMDTASMFVFNGINGKLYGADSNDETIYIRPVIVLKNNILWEKGDGTKANPYKVTL